MKAKHNKKRNTAFVYEALIKEATYAILKNDEKRINFLTPDQARKYINATQDNCKAAVALGLYAGIRTRELNRMYVREDPDQVSNDGRFYGIDFDAQEIHMKGAWTKTRKYRRLYNLPENLWAWLDTYCPRKGKLINANQDGSHTLTTETQTEEFFFRACKRARKRAGLKNWPRNARRRSFGSYGYHRGLEWCLDIMGHISGVKTFISNYKGASDPGSAASYFDCFPGD